jgi:glycerophosphoryl diester phosphodiesterase
MVWPFCADPKRGIARTARQAAAPARANQTLSLKVQVRRDAERISISMTGRQFIGWQQFLWLYPPSFRLCNRTQLTKIHWMITRYCFLLLLNLLAANAAELPLIRHNFVVIAHRGNHTRAHENTLTSLRQAIEAGVDYAEIDVRRTADGQYVLMHDRTVDRMTSGHGAVDQLTLAQISTLQVRDLRRPQIPPDRVPTFTEALELIKGRLNIYLDFKAGDRAVVAKAIRDAGVVRQILVYDGVDSVQEWHRVAPELPLIISPSDDLKKAPQLIDFVKGKRIEVLDGPWNAYSREMVEAANQAGAKVWPDIQTMNEDAAYFTKVLSGGFTGVQTDHPEELIAWLKERNLR